MKNWEEVLNKFVEKYISEDYFEGAIACGSCVTGNNNEFSDIDVHLVLKRGNEWRERGNLEIDGWLVEYFANPVNKYENYIEEEKIDRGNHTTNMFANGVVICDKHGEVKKLQDLAKKFVDCELPIISQFDLLASKYGCWDQFDELKTIYHEKRDSFYLVYYGLYRKLVELHGKIKQLREFSFSKLDKLLDNKIFRDNYGISKFYDEYDTHIIRECMNLDEREKMLERITEFYDYVMKIGGGFDINKFVLRSEVK